MLMPDLHSDAWAHIDRSVVLQPCVVPLVCGGFQSHRSEKDWYQGDSQFFMTGEIRQEKDESQIVGVNGLMHLYLHQASIYKC